MKVVAHDAMEGSAKAGAEKVIGRLDRLVEKGTLGAKSGAGFYEYPPKKVDEILRRRDRVLLAFLKALGEADRQPGG